MGFGEAPRAVEVESGLPAKTTVTEFWAFMPCGGCAKSVKGALEKVKGVQTVTIILKHKIVRVLGSASVEELTAALAATGKKYKLVGHGSPEDLSLPSAVVEFSSPSLFGVVRFCQLGCQLAQVDASFGHLPAGATAWAVHTYGDVTQGADSTGLPYAPSGVDLNLADLVADSSGNATFCRVVTGLKVSDLVGRSIVVRTSCTSNGNVNGVASVVALSGGGDVTSLCACDGTRVWAAGGACGVAGK